MRIPAPHKRRRICYQFKRKKLFFLLFSQLQLVVGVDVAVYNESVKLNAKKENRKKRYIVAEENYLSKVHHVRWRFMRQFIYLHFFSAFFLPKCIMTLILAPTQQILNGK